MHNTEQAILIFGRDERLGDFAENFAKSRPFRNCSIARIDDKDQFFAALKDRKHLCALVDIDADPSVLSRFEIEIQYTDVQFPSLFLTNDIANLSRWSERYLGIYYIHLWAHASEPVLSKAIASLARAYSLRRSNDRSRNTVHINAQLLALISHEIKVPLETLRVTQANLLGFDLEEKPRLLAMQSERAIAYMCEYVDNFIEHARLEKGAVKSFEEEFCIPTLIGEIIDLLYPKAALKGIALQCEIPCESSLLSYGDKKRLRQILINLLSNAVRYTDKGGVVIRVSTQERLSFEISDTGVGMSQTRLKEVFFSDLNGVASASAYEHSGGLGIGVALCRKLASLLNGEIAAHSEEGVGTTVRVAVPYKVYPQNRKNSQIRQRVNALLV